MQIESKHVHIVGICGKGIAPVAKMYKDNGWKVTGSEIKTGGWGPIAKFLKDNSLPFTIGYAEENISRFDTKPDLVIQAGSAFKKWPNPEVEWAKENGVEVISFPEALRDYLIKKNSVVVTGNYGKTSTSALMAWILEVAGKNPSYMIGGVPMNFEGGMKNTDSEYSVVEGDEHPTLKYKDEKPKFLYYKPKYTILSSAQWEHVNVFQTEESYIDAFRELVRLTVKNKGKLVLNAAGENNEKVKKAYKGKAVLYMMDGKTKLVNGGLDYSGEIVEVVDDMTIFNVYENEMLLWQFETPLIGEFNVENCLAAIAMTRTLGLELTDIVEAVKTFKGVKRRLEIRGKMKSGAIVIDDFAHSAVKAKAVLEALRTRYEDKKIIVIFDPHSSALADRKTLAWYPYVFDKADLVIIPRVTVKKSTLKGERVYGKDVVEAIRKTQQNVEYIPVDDNIIKTIEEQSNENTVVVFMSSGGWRGIIERLIK